MSANDQKIRHTLEPERKPTFVKETKRSKQAFAKQSQPKAKKKPKKSSSPGLLEIAMNAVRKRPSIVNAKNGLAGSGLNIK
jgi:hypothetical protein